MAYVQIHAQALSPEALEGLIEEFVTRDGTDYGLEERTLDDKKAAVRRQLDRGEVVIVFDPETVIDRSTYEDATIPATGIPYVIIAGEIVVQDGEVTTARPGRPIRAAIG